MIISHPHPLESDSEYIITSDALSGAIIVTAAASLFSATLRISFVIAFTPHVRTYGHSRRRRRQVAHRRHQQSISTTPSLAFLRSTADGASQENLPDGEIDCRHTKIDRYHKEAASGMPIYPAAPSGISAAPASPAYLAEVHRKSLRP
jgi:hypothetical protein